MTGPQQESSLVGLADSLLGRVAIDPELASRVESLRSYLILSEEVGQPFLSVILRTQGKRAEPFRDALLCLEAQSDQDFEVIVTVHDADAAEAAQVRESVEAMTPSLRERVRLVDVVGGTRATPLNAGVEAAQGQYVAVYDDDDILFGHWVEAFHTAAATSRGRLLRANVANQRVRAEAWGPRAGFRTVSRAVTEYPTSFSQLDHFVVNYSPFMSWAFPRALFAVYGARFDEALTVAEDWDMVLQGSLLLGVTDVPELTAIYHRWEDVANSYTSHSLDSWQASEQRVINRINDSVSLMPPGVMSASRDLVTYNLALLNFKFLFNGSQLRFPLNIGWKLARPPLVFAVRLRSRLRRMAAR